MVKETKQNDQEPAKQQTAGTETKACKALDIGVTDLSGRVWRQGHLKVLERGMTRHWLEM